MKEKQCSLKVLGIIPVFFFFFKIVSINLQDSYTKTYITRYQTMYDLVSLKIWKSKIKKCQNYKSLKQSLISFPSQSFFKNKEINNSGTKFKKINFETFQPKFSYS